MKYTEEQLRICLEDIGNLRRMHLQQYKRLAAAKEMSDGRASGQAIFEIVSAHQACPDMLDIVEYLLTERLGAMR